MSSMLLEHAESSLKKKKLSFICSDKKIASLLMTLPTKIHSSFLSHLFEEENNLKDMNLDLFDSEIVLSVLKFIENGQISFSRNVSITPQYLKKIYSACRYFMISIFPEIFEISILGEKNHREIENSTIYGKFDPDNGNFKTFTNCVFTKLQTSYYSCYDNVKFEKCLFQNCSMQSISFDENCNFSDCNFIECNFSGTSITNTENCIFRDCDMINCRYESQIICINNIFDQCILREFFEKKSNLETTSKYGNVFKSCDLSGAVFKCFENCKEFDCVLTFTTFDNSKTGDFYPNTKCISTIIIK
jgi:uncharacterized protein YjbI with pentapeptide repeats